MSNFQSALSTALAICLGAILAHVFSQSPANASIPTPSVGYGQNPVVSWGGYLASGSIDEVFTAPGTQDVVITDVLIASKQGKWTVRSHQTQFLLDSDAVIGEFITMVGGLLDSGSGGSVHDKSIQHSFSSGLRIPAGDTLRLSVLLENGWSTGGTIEFEHGVHYTISGYYARP